MDFLKEILGDELFKQVVEKLGDKKLILDDGKMIAKANFDVISEKYKQAKQQLEEQKTEYEKQLSDNNSKLSEFEKYSQLTASQKDEILKLKASNEAMKSEYDGKVKAYQKQSLIDLELIKLGANDPKEIKVHLDLDKIAVDGDKLIGFNDQVEGIKKERSYLFGSVKKVGTPPESGGSPQPLSALEQQLNESIKNTGEGSIQSIMLRRTLEREQKK